MQCTVTTCSPKIYLKYCVWDHAIISQTGYVTEDNFGNPKMNPIALFSVCVNGTMWFISSKKWSRKSACLLWICSSITCDTNTNVITYATVRCSKQCRKIDIMILLCNKAPLVSLSHCFSQICGLHEDNDLNGKLCRLCCLDANTEIWTFHQYRKYSSMPPPLGLAKKNTSSSSTEVLLFKVYYFF